MNQPEFQLPDDQPVTPSEGFAEGVLHRVHHHRRIRKVRQVSLVVLFFSVFTSEGLRRGWFEPGRENSEQVARARNGVDWLLQSQTEKGNWNAEDWGGHPSFSQGVSALATLALLVAPDPAPAPHVDRALSYLTEQVEQFSASRSQGPEYYNHLLSLNALLEADLLAPDHDRQALLRSSLADLVRRQQPSGGWGYAEDQPMGYGVSERDHANSAITWWVCHLLRKARPLRVPGREEAMTRGDRWLARRFPSADAIAYQENARGLAAPKDALYWMAVQSRRNITGQVETSLPPDAYRDVLRTGALNAPTPPAEVVRNARNNGLQTEDRWWKAGGRVYVTAATVISLVPRGGV